MASLRARHSRLCALGGIETRGPLTERAKIEGCTCKPLLSIRGARGANRERVGRDVRDALRALAKRNVQEGDGEPVVIRDLPFPAWFDQWLASLERKPTTKAAYVSTGKYAKATFGNRAVRRVTTADVTDLNRILRELGLGDSTRAKHLKVLSACFQSAVAHGYAGHNPVKRLPKGEKPRPRKREAAYFEDAELPKLIAAQADPLWRTALLVAVKTGLRLGELTGLTWADIDLTGSVIHVRRTVTAGANRALITAPKSYEKREVEITDDVVKLLGEWWGMRDQAGSYGKTAKRLAPVRSLTPAGVYFDYRELVFPRFAVGGFVPEYQFREIGLYAALVRAGIPRLGPTGELRTFHSLRHTYARICLEHGLLETWLQRQLGHSSLAVTVGIYGHWSKKGRAEQAAKLEAAFNV